VIGAIIQARTSSTRLPRKVLLELPFGSGVTVLQQVIRRIKQSKRIEAIVVATTEDKDDDAIVDIALREGVLFFRGSKKNVLERYYKAAQRFGLSTIVRITSDCPCIDAAVVDTTIDHYIGQSVDYCSVSSARAFPHGLDNEVFSFSILEKVYRNATEDYEREHVTPYIYRTKPEQFKICFPDAPANLRRPDIRVTLDTEEDYTLLCAVFDYLYGLNRSFDAVQVVNLFNQKPWLSSITRRIMQKKIHNSVEDEVAEALRLMELQDLRKAKAMFEACLAERNIQFPGGDT